VECDDYVFEGWGFAVGVELAADEDVGFGVVHGGVAGADFFEGVEPDVVERAGGAVDGDGLG